MSKRSRNHSAVTTLFVAASAIACASQDGSSASDLLSTASSSDGIPWETFRASAEIAPNGALVVEGDMAFSSEAKLLRYWEENRAPGRGQELSVNTKVVNGITADEVWPFPQHLNLTYCVATEGFTSQQLSQLMPALDAATAAWGKMAAVRYVRTTVPAGTCNPSNTGVAFDIRRRSGTSSAFFPFDPRSMRTLWVGDVAFTNTSWGRTLTGIMTHELGHTLGFRHEHVWISCNGEDPTGDGGTARQVTEYDEQSVMHYPECRDPAGGGFVMSPLDVAGTIKIYGLHPALVMSVI